MDSNFTPNDLIRYLFHEMPAREAGVFRQWLKAHPAWQVMLHRMQRSLQELKQVPDGPSEDTLQQILAFSRQLAPEHV